jgi:hypothetical protein
LGRLVRLTLVGRDGEVLGSLPPFRVEPPWWSEVASIVAGARSYHGAEITVLRLLDVDGSPEGQTGGDVTYLAELHGRVPRTLTDEHRALAEHPRRLPWARPGGPAADLAWADAVLAEHGRPRTGPARQLRTWNLSSISRLPTAAGDVWLKVTPAVLADEGAVLSTLARHGVPVAPLLGFDEEGRVLLEHVPGDDQWTAPRERLLAMVDILLDLQSTWSRPDRIREILTTGAQDWRAPCFAPAASRTVTGWAESLPGPARRPLTRLVERLDERFAAIECCGLPDTLLHGDFHPGNFRSDGSSLVLLDWGDCGVGHPLLDMAAFVDRLDGPSRTAIEQTWLQRWATLLPGSDPWRAGRLVRPLAALRLAVVYHRFLEAFEPSEGPYHASDVPRWLLVAASEAQRE